MRRPLKPCGCGGGFLWGSERSGFHHLYLYGANGKLVLPFLGAQYGEAIESGDLHLAFDAAHGSFNVWQYEHRFPISPLTALAGRFTSKTSERR